MADILNTTEHRPYPLPAGPWRMTQRWNDLLFAHWPVAVENVAALIPPGLIIDSFDGYAWVGVVPFQMDRVRTRIFGDHCIAVPTTSEFCELNLRTYVHSTASGLHGVFFFALDAASALAVLGARMLFQLPYFLASMQQRIEPDRTIHYDSRRLLTQRSVRFRAQYRGLGEVAAPAAGSLEYFLAERYCLFTTVGGRVLVGHIHHLPWPLQTAEAEIQIDELPSAHGIALPKRAPLLHFAKEQVVYIWSLRRDQPPEFV